MEHMGERATDTGRWSRHSERSTGWFVTFRSSAIIAIALCIVGPAAAQVTCPAGSTPLSTSHCLDAATRRVTVGATAACKSVCVDQSFAAADALGKIEILDGGKLMVPDPGAGNPPLELDVRRITIYGKSSTFEVGTAPGTSPGPITGRVIIRFTGNRPETLGRDSDDCPTSEGGSAFHKGLEVCAGGVLSLYGAEGVPQSGGISWTYLSAPAGPLRYDGASGVGSPVPSGGNMTLQLAADVSSDWKVGDWISVATTSYSPFETEFVQIAGVTPVAGGSQITIPLAQELAYYHFGGPAPSTGTCTDPLGKVEPASFCDGYSKNYGIDERAEVGLISRNIQFTSDAATLPAWTANTSYTTATSSIQATAAGRAWVFTAQTTGTSGAAMPAFRHALGAEICDNGVGANCAGGVVWKNVGVYDPHWGGEVKIRKGFGQVAIQGVQFEKMGKDRLGSYPIHFHKDGNVNDAPLVNANSVDHSYNKCITVHSTDHLMIQNNVCARIVGHIFYEEMGDEFKINFTGNLGMGAMSNSFNINAPNPQQQNLLVSDYWWVGDNLAQPIGYDGFNIPNKDDVTNPTHGSCLATDNAGNTVFRPPNADGTCPEVANFRPLVYYEPASGFWIVNPGTSLIDNSIAGCQGTGRGYWYVPPPSGDLKYLPVGQFLNNRVHGCYAGLYAEPEDGVRSEQLFPHVKGERLGQPITATFNSITATRIRDRGVWLRPSYYIVENARLATSRDDVSLVTAGGVDGTAPGNWSIFEDSVVVGISRNNVDRFGPCPYPNQAGPGTGSQGSNFGCIDFTPGVNEDIGRSYAPAWWNMAGFMIYDGPARIFHNRFVNFLRDPSPFMTAQDQAFLGWYSVNNRFPNGSRVYEGDAALGWFNVNQSSYPNSQVGKEFIWDNVDLRHQIFTSLVNFGGFADGDQNTVLVDRDGTLTGYKVADLSGATILSDVFPFSLNNLPYNAASNAVDECLAEGRQDTLFEQRPTSLIMPGDIATFEFSALYPRRFDKEGNLLESGYKQKITFTRDQVDPYGNHESMTLTGRNGLGLWEPKVIGGYGYTISAAVMPNTGVPDKAGIPKFIDLGFTEAEKSNLSPSNPFYIRVGICYADQVGRHPKLNPDAPEKLFTVQRGVKSWGLGNPSNTDSLLNTYWNYHPDCYNIDSAPGNIKNIQGGCPADPVSMSLVDALAKLVDNSGHPLPDKYYYDEKTGMLFFYVMQRHPNAEGPSPLGACLVPNKAKGCLTSCADGMFQEPWPGCSCNANNPCPQATGEDYYACPAAGCPLYAVTLNDAAYEPGPSNCTPYAPDGDIPTPAPTPASQNQLVLVDGTNVTAVPNTTNPAFPHSTANPAPVCNVNAPAPSPPWAGQVPPGTPATLSYFVAAPPSTMLAIDPVVPILVEGDTNSNFDLVGLQAGVAYTLTASGPRSSCNSVITPGGTPSSPSYTATPGNPNCSIAPSGGGQINLGIPE
ncbi:MAG TPA: G8 domain-containing protein [Candidatus Binataceae bacterium]|nr:G8 domain-containing protein [Candidatus Binataceae bacterium]